MLNGKIYVIGGTTGTYPSISDIGTVEVYDPYSDEWQTKTSMTHPRTYLGVSSINGKIYAVGGGTNTNYFLDFVEEYDPNTDTWGDKTSLPTPRRSLGVETVGGRIYAFGGEYNYNGTNVVEEYEPLSNTWRQVTSMNSAAGWTSSCVFGNSIYAISAGYDFEEAIISSTGDAYTSTAAVTLLLSATDDSGTVTQMRFSNDNSTWSTWEAYATSKAWTLTSGDGTKTVYVQFKDAVGNVSTTYSDTIILDTALPTGSISINNGASTTTVTGVTLTLSCTDSGSGCAEMQFSTDNTTWSDWEAYATSKAWTLTSGDGTKTVYAQFKDGAGNISTNYSDTIILDTSAPIGSITINGGASSTSSTSVSLTLAATDDSGAVSQMRFSNDNSTWSAWEAYAASKAWTLSSSDGTKTVYAQFRDATGNISSTVNDSISLIGVIDLVVSSINAPSSAYTGLNISIPNTVRNQGTSKSVSSYVKFYLSTDVTIDSSDIYLGQRSVSAISGGTSSSATTSLKIPVTVTAGTYYIGAIADATETNPESDETMIFPRFHGHRVKLGCHSLQLK